MSKNKKKKKNKMKLFVDEHSVIDNFCEGINGSVRSNDERRRLGFLKIKIKSKNWEKKSRRTSYLCKEELPDAGLSQQSISPWGLRHLISCRFSCDL